jgi:hypothetical protein
MRNPLTLSILFISILMVACGPASQDAGANAQNAASPQADPEKALAPAPHYETEAPSEEMASFVPKGYETVKAEGGQIMTKGDLNNDGIDDMVVLLQDMSQDEGNCAILVTYGAANGKYKASEVTGDMGPEPLMYADPGQIKIVKGILIFHYQSMRWGADLKFRYEPKYGDLRLIGADTENFGNAMHDGAGSTSTNYLTGQRIENFMRYNETKEDLEDLPEVRKKVSTKLKAFNGYTEDDLYEDM